MCPLCAHECGCLCTVDRKGQQGAPGCPLLTGLLWRARGAAPESSLMVEMDGQYPCGVIPFMTTAHLWYMARRQMPAREAVGNRGDWTGSSGWCGGRVYLWTPAIVQGHAWSDWVPLCTRSRGRRWQLLLGEPTRGQWTLRALPDRCVFEVPDWIRKKEITQTGQGKHEKGDKLQSPTIYLVLTANI